MGDEERQKSGWTEAGLDAVVGWFPGLPRWIKVIFASATIYLILCFVSQIPPLALPQAVGGEIKTWLDQSRQEHVEQRVEAAAERADLIALLLEQNRELRKQAVADPALADRVRTLERKMDALLFGHPVDRARYEAMR